MSPGSDNTTPTNPNRTDVVPTNSTLTHPFPHLYTSEGATRANRVNTPRNANVDPRDTDHLRRPSHGSPRITNRRCSNNDNTPRHANFDRRDPTLHHRPSHRGSEVTINHNNQRRSAPGNSHITTDDVHAVYQRRTLMESRRSTNSRTGPADQPPQQRRRRNAP